MTEAVIINGNIIAEKLKIELKRKIDILKTRHHVFPSVAIMQIGSNKASDIYIRKKIQLGQELGIHIASFPIPDNTTEKTVLTKLEMLNHDPKTHGILIQLPLPEKFNTNHLIFSVNPRKDVDGFHPENLGLLVSDQPRFIPCTALGCISLIKQICKDLTGKKALVIGRSLIVGKPTAYLLMKENCTVTIAHRYTKNLIDECKQADILVVAIGQERFIKKDWLKPGAIVIDVGMNHFYEGETGESKVVGDVDFDQAKEVCSAITPVPGGVGPMTVYFLMKNSVIASCIQKGISYRDLS